MHEYFFVVILSVLNLTSMFRGPHSSSLRIKDSVQMNIFTKYLQWHEDIMLHSTLFSNN